MPKKKSPSPPAEKPLQVLGSHTLLRSIGKGGMGEVYAAYDKVCERTVALKIIRAEFAQQIRARKRFLKEASIPAKLHHPSIIPIYSIDQEGKTPYYTMPLVEGNTFKELLRKAKENERMNVPLPTELSLHTFLKIFLQVCQATSYIHNKGIIHCDLKPENIIVGRFGEVLLLDWGLAEVLDTLKDAPPPKKVLGTLHFMPPERVKEGTIGITLDLYALGVMLYQLLTLRLPFRRPSLKIFRQILHQENLTPPEEMAPHRDIPYHLSQVAIKCLCADPDRRYQKVEELIEHIEHFIEGKPDWSPVETLHIDHKEGWEFQENILIGKYRALTEQTEVFDWVALMISKREYSGNTRIETTLTLQEECEGIGIMLAMPRPEKRRKLEEGLCLWLSSQKESGIALHDTNIEILRITEDKLTPHTPHSICIEKKERSLLLLIDGKCVLDYTTQNSLTGSYIGLLYKDREFSMDPLKISMGSQEALINCLAIPDAFCQRGEYRLAREEYQRIAHSFKGRFEGREARFRLALSALEEASSLLPTKSRGHSSTHFKASSKLVKRKIESLLSLALKTFGELHKTPAAPLEYLGKAQVYAFTGEVEEEIKCLELSMRKFSHHPLLYRIEEYILSRLHESSEMSRSATFHFALLTLRYLPHSIGEEKTHLLFQSLSQSLSPLSFLHWPHTPSCSLAKEVHLSISLSFWLNKPLTLFDLFDSNIQNLEEKPLFSMMILYSALHLNAYDAVENRLTNLSNDPSIHKAFPSLSPSIKCILDTKSMRTKKRILIYLQTFPKELLGEFQDPSTLPLPHVHALSFLFTRALSEKDPSPFFPLISPFLSSLSPHSPLFPLAIAHLILNNEHEKAKQLLNKPPLPPPVDSPLFPLFLSTLEGLGESIESFLQSSIHKPPRFYTLLPHALKGRLFKKPLKRRKLFLFEKRELALQEYLLYTAQAHKYGKAGGNTKMEEKAKKQAERGRKQLLAYQKN